MLISLPDEPENEIWVRWPTRQTGKAGWHILKFLQLFEKWLINRSYALNLSSCEVKAGKKSGLKGIRTHDLCGTGPEARVSKLLVITGPVKLFCFPF